MEGAQDRNRDILDQVAELTREAGMLTGVFGALDGWVEMAKKTPDFDAILWFKWVLVATFSLVATGVLFEKYRKIG